MYLKLDFTINTVLSTETVFILQLPQLFSAKWHGSTDVAVKIQNINCVTTAAFLDEAQILKTLQHPNILELRGVCSQIEPVYLLMEYMPRGQLSKYLREMGTNLALSQLIHFGAQVSLYE